MFLEMVMTDEIIAVGFLIAGVFALYTGLGTTIYMMFKWYKLPKEERHITLDGHEYKRYINRKLEGRADLMMWIGVVLALIGFHLIGFETSLFN